MAKTSVHIKACDIASSELHNKRDRELCYIRKDLSHRNESYNYTGQSLSAELKRIQQDVKKLTGRKIQKNAIPIKEGVVVISEKTTMQELQHFCQVCQNEFGMIPLQIHIHRDEGHKEAKNWKPNLHAHIVWRMYNEKGRNVRLTQIDCSRMQTFLSECLGMERGKTSDKKHVDALQYKIEAKTKQIEQLQEDVTELNSKKAVKEATINTIKATGEWFTDRINGNKKALQERIKQLEAELPIEREKARQNGKKEAKNSILQTIANTIQVRFQKLNVDTICQFISKLISRNKSLERENEALQAQNKALQARIDTKDKEMYQKGLNVAKTQINGLLADIRELIRDYAGGNQDVIEHYSTPRKDRLWMSPMEKSRQKRMMVERKEEQRQEQQEKQEQVEKPLSRGFRR